MHICPVDLECCGRAECAAGHCAMSGEPALAPCAECGTLIIWVRPQGLCVECIAVPETQET